MVRQVEGSAAERWLNRVTGWIPAPLRSYTISLFALLVVTAAAYPLMQSTPRGARGLPGLIVSLLYLVILLGSSWLGYGAGILTWTLIFVAPGSSVSRHSARCRPIFSPASACSCWFQY